MKTPAIQKLQLERRIISGAARDIASIELKLMLEAAKLGMTAFRNNHCDGALSVGAIITDAQYQIIATGYSREWDSLPDDPRPHAEGIAIAKALNKLGDNAPRLGDMRGSPMVVEPRKRTVLPEGCIIFTGIECCRRRTQSTSCAERALRAGISNFVVGMREPNTLVEQCGIEYLRAAGAKPTQRISPEIYAFVCAANPHITFPPFEQCII